MSSADLTAFLLSLDDTQLATVRRLLDSRLVAYRLDAFSYPDFERLAQLSVNERYLLIRQIPDATLAEALKAGSEYLRDAMLRVVSRNRRSKVEAKMRRLGPIRQSIAESAVDAILMELERQQASGAICSFLSAEESEGALNVVRAGLPDEIATDSRIATECAGLLSECLHGASDHALREVVTGADPCDLALLLLQLRSVALAERLLTAGEFRYLRELLAAMHAVQAGRDAPEPGRPDHRLWQAVAPALLDNDGVSIDDHSFRTPAQMPNPANTSAHRLHSAAESDTSQCAGISTARPRPAPPVQEHFCALQTELEVLLQPPVLLTASQQRRIAQIEASDWALANQRSGARALRAFCPRRSDGAE